MDFEIVDENGTRSWLSEQDQQTRVWFVTRIALRSLPAALGEPPFDQRNSLRLLHHLLIATVGCFDLQAAKTAAPFAFGGINYHASAQGIFNNMMAFSPSPNRRVLYGDEQPENDVLRSAAGDNVICNAIAWAIELGAPMKSVEFGGGHWELAWLVGPENARRLAASDMATSREWPPLWGTAGRPKEFLEEYSNLDDFFASDPNTWDFWLRWFKAIHDGTPLPWELSRLIASTLKDQDWNEGAKHVAQEIERIEALFWVRHALSELSKDRSVRQLEDRHGIGGNHPPEEFEIPASMQNSFTVIWEAVDDISEQAEADSPKKSLVSAALKKLTEALRLILGWLATKANLAVDTAIKSSITAAGGYFVLNPTKFQALIETVKNWIVTIP